MSRRSEERQKKKTQTKTVVIALICLAVSILALVKYGKNSKGIFMSKNNRTTYTDTVKQVSIDEVIEEIPNQNEIENQRIKEEEEAKKKAEEEAKKQEEAKKKEEEQKRKAEEEAKKKAEEAKKKAEAARKAAEAAKKKNEEAAKKKTEEAAKKKAEEQKNKKYYIKINIAANVVNIYTQDDKGSYTVPYKAMVCSTGVSTPSAGKKFTIPSGTAARGKWGLMVGGVYAQYYTRIYNAILFHSVPYKTQSKSNLEYWEYDKLGTKASAGCIRLTVQDAKWIYDNISAGTVVEFYSDSKNPGPLGKPTAKKISKEAKNLRVWDPTDPDSNNPWKNK